MVAPVGEFYQIFKEEIMPIINHTNSEKIEEEGKLPIFFM